MAKIASRPFIKDKLFNKLYQKEGVWVFGITDEVASKFNQVFLQSEKPINVLVI